MALAPGKRVPAARTPLSQACAEMALQDALVAIVGAKLPKAAVCVLLAHSQLEVGDPSMLPAFNFGGIKATAGYDWAEWSTKEGHGANEVRVRGKFRAYKTAQEGAEDFVRLLANSPRYARAWKKLEIGDPTSYAIELGKAGYFTADPLAYAKLMNRLWSQCALRMLQYGVTPDEVKRFQKDHSIEADGLVGPETRGALRLALGS